MGLCRGRRSTEYRVYSLVSLVFFSRGVSLLSLLSLVGTWKRGLLQSSTLNRATKLGLRSLSPAAVRSLQCWFTVLNFSLLVSLLVRHVSPLRGDAWFRSGQTNEAIDLQFGV
ncbi:hypothetical protein BJY00DRAFT_91643 [Aspergillus carlsbadensis]|nr:hypothetical protein BJY00DRAFT_91643 [Aspergillus carlsbadensis]